MRKTTRVSQMLRQGAELTRQHALPPLGASEASMGPCARTARNAQITIA
jgi:hypothetical protein